MGTESKKKLPDTRDVPSSNIKNITQVNFNADLQKCQEAEEKKIKKSGSVQEVILYHSTLPSASNILVLNKALNQYGSMQIDVAIEEMGELIQALIKNKRNSNPETLEHIAEEMADVIIMLLQLQMFFDNKEDVKGYMERKIERLKTRLEENKNGDNRTC